MARPLNLTDAGQLSIVLFSTVVLRPVRGIQTMLQHTPLGTFADIERHPVPGIDQGVHIPFQVLGNLTTQTILHTLSLSKMRHHQPAW
ncbi:hypothetical protein ACGF5S_17115 [Nocardia nova]|uniref:hypothetical protein n=1 Tax=Nocardia nova TaxID=37330 RepID=UPI0037229D58